jgi:hypothetical protein
MYTVHNKAWRGFGFSARGACLYKSVSDYFTESVINIEKQLLLCGWHSADAQFMPMAMQRRFL